MFFSIVDAIVGVLGIFTQRTTHIKRHTTVHVYKALVLKRLAQMRKTLVLNYFEHRLITFLRKALCQ